MYEIIGGRDLISLKEFEKLTPDGIDIKYLRNNKNWNKSFLQKYNEYKKIMEGEFNE